MNTPAENELESMGNEPNLGASPMPGGRLRSQSRKILEDVKELGGIAADEAGAAAARARERGGELLEHGRERIYKVRDSIGSYVAENPFKALFLSLGAGALLGFLVRRR